MPPSKKGGKSSASSATRKKQAAKAARKAGEDPKAAAASTGPSHNGVQRGEKKDKKSKKDAKRKKVFIPPPKPPQPPPDPLDTLGLATLLPPSLVVLLRKAAKKDVITRSRALEGLINWIDAKDEEGESAALGDEERESSLVMMLPSWVHLFPRLAASPTRRLRLMTAQILSKLLDPSLATRSELLLAPQYTEAILGPWAILAWDTDRATSAVARESWDRAISWTSQSGDQTISQLYLVDYLAGLANFLSTLLLQGSSTSSLPPSGGEPQMSSGNAHVGPGNDALRDAKNRDDTNVEEDSKAIDARLAAAALGSLTWILTSYELAWECGELVNLLHSDALWTTLYTTIHNKSEGSSVQHFGVDYPVTRSRAWILLATTTSQHPQLLGQIIHIVAPIALEAAWEERDQSVIRNMLDALLPMLTKHNEAWTIKAEGDDDSDEEEDGSEEEEEGADEDGQRRKPRLAASAALAGFQDWIQNGCGGSPRLGLPAVLVLLSTIPASVLPPSRIDIEAFLDLFWSSRDGVWYESDRLSKGELLKSFAECSAYLIGKLSKSSLEATAEVGAEQLGNRLWKQEVLSSCGDGDEHRASALTPPILLRAQESIDERIVSTIRNLAKLGEDGSVVQRLLDIIRDRMLEVAKGIILSDTPSIARATAILCSLASDASPSLLQVWAKTLASELTEESARSLHDMATEGGSLSSRTSLLSSLLIPFESSGCSPEVETFARSTLPNLVRETKLPPAVSRSFMSAYLKANPNDQARQFLVTIIEAAASITDQRSKVQTLQALLDGVPASYIAGSELASTTKLDDVVLSIAHDINDGSAAADGESLLNRLIEQPRPFIEAATVNEVLALLISRLHAIALDTIGGGEKKGSQIQQADRIAGILANWTKGESERARHLLDANLFEAAASAAFTLNFLSQKSASEPSRLWRNLTVLGQAETTALNTLRQKLSDTDVESIIVLEGARKYFATSQASVGLSILDILPSKAMLDESLNVAAASLKVPSSLSILDPLVVASQQGSHTDGIMYDIEGFGPYARSAYALLLFLEESRSVARSQPWALPHIVMLALLCEDELQLPGGSGGLLQPAKFSDQSAGGHRRLSQLLQRCITVSSSLLAALSGSLSETWHSSATEALQKTPEGPFEDDPALQIMASLWKTSLSQQSPSGSGHLTRIFSRLLNGILSFTSAGEQEGSRWMRLAQVVESKAPHLSQAIIYSAKSYVFDTPLYDRQRSDIVSRLASTPPSQANGQGLTLLRLAVAIAPPPESSMVFVPQQRVVFLLQGLQRWVASDEDLDEEINTRLAELFLHIAPLVQEMPGSHLDFFYDLIESNLEVASSLSEESALPALYHSLKVLDLLDELSASNSLLRETWKEHEESILELLQPLFKSLALQEDDRRITDPSSDVSVGKELTAELLVGVVRQHRKAFQSDEFYSTFCELLKSPMREVQAASFRLLAGSIRSNVQRAVMEAALEREDDDDDDGEKVVITLAPPQLLEAVRRRMDVSSEDLEDDVRLSRQVMSYLLAWLAIFEHFEEASLQLRSIYAGQLQQEGLLANGLLPLVFTLVEPRKSRRTKEGLTIGPFDPDRYAVDEIFVDLLEPSDPASLRQLATHIYFRALLYTPALVREWWLGIKDRQLSLGVASFTSRHCTPLIASRELSQLRHPDSLSRLQDESMTIRILGWNEVVGTYTIDEHPMEIGIKIPASYPLQGVEVRDVRRVGVSESQWRAWLLGVQQLIVGQDGLVFDALMLFKRNAELKFAGFEDAECSICYAIISPTDRSLPTKPCRTCAKKFHATCLFRWVTSSGSSTCPLCRSIL